MINKLFDSAIINQRKLGILLIGSVIASIVFKAMNHGVVNIPTFIMATISLICFAMLSVPVLLKKQAGCDKDQ